MNGDRIRGGAFGFRLNSLSRFYDLKSNDGKLSLFQFIINEIMDTNKNILDFMPV